MTVTLVLAERAVVLKTDRRYMGEGASSVVYRATERDSGRIVALKKSRVSVRVKRTNLHHEARVLQLLQGHPAVPAVYAYGRVHHFELLTMQLLGQDLGELVRTTGPLAPPAVVDIADQLLDALAHLQRHALVHRDIKPNNVLLKHPRARARGQPMQICLIDFGLAYRPRAPPRPAPPPSAPEDGPPRVLGTLPYASINAHHQRDLMFRDDVESLAYVLVFLRRGTLPWFYFAACGTSSARCRQVLAQKERYSGARLGEGIPDVFGALLDYARGMAADEVPRYDAWRQRFRQCASSHDSHGIDDDVQQAPLKYFPDPAPEPALAPVKAGDVVLLQLLPVPTVEGYPRGAERSYVPDPALPPHAWRTPARPALVLDIAWDAHAHLYTLTALAIRRGAAGAGDDADAAVPIAGPGAAPDPARAVALQPRDWPLTDACCYAYPQPQTFHCAPPPEPVPVVWAADAAGLALLRRSLDTRPSSPARLAAAQDALASADADARHAARITRDFVAFYAQLHPLRREHAAAAAAAPPDDAAPEAWGARRAWFDECVRAARRHGLGDGYWWTGAAFSDARAPAPGAHSDSYHGYDSWWGTRLQGERDATLTLSLPAAAGDGGATGTDTDTDTGWRIRGLDWAVQEPQPWECVQEEDGLESA